MNKDVIASKIEIIRKTLERIRIHTPETYENFSENYDAQDIVSLNLERSIQACVDIAAHIIADTDMPPAQTMAESFASLEKQRIIAKEVSERMKKAVGFRNISVHDYQEIDWHIVYSICTKNLSDFEEFVRQVVIYTKI